MYKNIGWQVYKLKDEISLKTTIDFSILIDKEKLANFYPEEKPYLVKEKLNLKIKALKNEISNLEAFKRG
jgi:hypothetical protein